MSTSPAKSPFRLMSFLRARCPNCHEGKVRAGVFKIKPRCEVCGYDFYPEPGFYVGAMAVSFLLTAALTIPPTIALKVMDVDIRFLVAFPLIEYLFLGTF